MMVTKKKTRRLLTSEASNWPLIERQAIESEGDFELPGCTIKIQNVDRSVWQGVTKADLIMYYHRVAGYILPYLNDRPQSLHVKLVNWQVEGFYIKDMEGRQPDCGEIFTDTRRHEAAGKRPVIDYLVCNNEATLLWMVNLGCIDINPWNSRRQEPEEPDYIAIDLDPTEKNPDKVDLKKLLTCAIATKEYCEAMGIRYFAKTSGKTGMHFYLPCRGLDFKRARYIAEYICGQVHELVPDESTISNSKNSRGNKVYLDPSQNDYADTLAAPYSARPYKSPTVSTPLLPSEINYRLDPSQFTIHTMMKRLEKVGDLFAGLMQIDGAIRNNMRLAELVD